jgi:hypothetical protein
MPYDFMTIHADKRSRFRVSIRKQGQLLARNMKRRWIYKLLVVEGRAITQFMVVIRAVRFSPARAPCR